MHGPIILSNDYCNLSLSVARTQRAVLHRIIVQASVLIPVLLHVAMSHHGSNVNDIQSLVN